MSHFERESRIKETQSKEFTDHILCNPSGAMLKLMSECFSCLLAILSKTL